MVNYFSGDDLVNRQFAYQYNRISSSDRNHVGLSVNDFGVKRLDELAMSGCKAIIRPNRILYFGNETYDVRGEDGEFLEGANTTLILPSRIGGVEIENSKLSELYWYKPGIEAYFKPEIDWYVDLDSLNDSGMRDLLEDLIIEKFTLDYKLRSEHDDKNQKIFPFMNAV